MKQDATLLQRLAGATLAAREATDAGAGGSGRCSASPWRRGLRRCAAAAAVLALLPAQAAGPVAPDIQGVAALADLGLALLPAGGAANAVVSPLAAAAALGLVQAGASGPAEREIEALFGTAAQGAHALRHTLPALLRQLQGRGGAAAPLALAARMWVDTGAAASVPAAYARRLASRWQADALRVPFARNEATRAQINDWTAQHTAGRVKDLLPAGSVSAATQLALTTAVHFRSAWEKPFDAARTEPRPFQTASGHSKPVPTMVDERSVLQARVDGHLVLEIPFAPGDGRNGFALLVAVPDDGSPAAPGLTGAQLARWRLALAPARCELALPRFAIAPQSDSLKPALQALGVKTVFTDVADLRPMLGRGARQMHLDDVHHAAGIEVDEQGGVAVAAVAATVRAKSLALAAPPCAVARAFAFALVHRSSGTPVFVGRVGDPSITE